MRIGGICLEKEGCNRPSFNGRSLVFLLYIFVVISGLYITISESTDQQEKDWTWSVTTGDIEGYDKNYPSNSYPYMINDSVNISWNIIPSPSSEIIDTMLQVYPKDDDKSKYKPYPITIPPNKGYKYVSLVDASFLGGILAKNEYIYNVEVSATAIDHTSENTTRPNEWHTHKIEITVTKPGILVIQKKIPGWNDADLSGWRFRVVGPVDTVLTKTAEKVTDSSGMVVFSGLRPGMYRVEEVKKDGWLSIPPRNVEVKPGLIEPIGPNEPQEFINTPNTLTIIKKDSEGRSLSGWAFKVSGSKVTEITKPTDSSGITVVKGLPSGEYNIQEEPSKVGWRQISTEPDLPLIFGSGESKSVVITNANEGSIKISKKDSEGNPLAGWSFTVAGPDSATVVTDISGVAVASGLLPGEYTVKEIQQSKWVNVTDIAREVTLQPGENKQLEPFINAPIIPLTIVKFDDKNRNGRLDRDTSGSPIENGLSGWTFIVEGPRGSKTIVGPTNAAGIVAIDLTPGEYKVTEDISSSSKPGWICTTSNPQTIRVSRGAADTVEFGNKENKLTLVAFNDTSMDGKREGNESGLAGWTFVLKGPNEINDPPETTTRPTGVDGTVAVDGLKPGSYTVTENLAGGWINTTPISTSVNIVAGEEKQVEFGNIKPSRIEIFKFNDTNRNGKLDAGENGVPGWSFNVTGPGGFVDTTNPTDAEGTAVIEGLFPGNYVITEPQVDRWLNTTPRIESVAIGFGDSQIVTFANYYCQRCHRINDQPKINTSSDRDLKVTKEVSSISAENINKNGVPVNYNIKICPSGGLERIAAIPTDIVIAVDNSRSLSNLSESAISGVSNLVDGISKNDKQKVTRLGLVSWNDKNFSKIEVPLTDDYNSVASAANNIIFPEGNYTDYQEAINTALLPFEGIKSDAGRTKKIVFITDANDSGYIAPSNMPGRDYAIYAIVVGNNKGIKPYEMLDKLTRDHQGYIRSINNISELQDALIQMVTAGSRIKNVHLVETLPNYLILDNGTAEDDSGKIQLNGDNKEWTTTTISWDVGDLSGCWNTTFDAFFCWKLPADVNQQTLTSYVNYTDDTGVERTILLPEYEINIVTASRQESQGVPLNTAEKKQPGFEALFAAMGFSIAGYIYRRRDAGD
ncbi:MAG: SpaA isopeptide-forming pilin-related protein [Methanothrix sp.]